jgi:ADP-ribosylglycohydrolase
MNQEYYQKVYEGLLGKVIGVYLGRPFEGWLNKTIEEKFGEIDRFVADEMNKPLVVADDDISGTLVFFKTLADSGKFENAENIDFADNWLNYLIEHETVLWWGGYGVSTEHTAFINLKRGVLPPESGSSKLNGKCVAEQIGAQIFIDAFGLATPGKPELAARLADKAARVSHDGEAVYGAIMQAVMVSIAFEEKDIHEVIRKALKFIPKDSVIAELYPFVYKLKKECKDWRATFKCIEEKYGYHHFKGGNCHMIPNHAVMAMAFIYSENDFHFSQLIVNTAGWDTDCNAANVGTVMGVLCGIEGINKKVNFQSFFHDRLLLPTADGTDAVSDVLIEAFKIAKVGSKIMDYSDETQNLKGHHFALKGSYHGYREYGEGVKVLPASKTQANGLYINCNLKQNSDCGVDHLSIPILDKPLGSSSYLLHGTPQLYSGMNITFDFGTSEKNTGLKISFWVETVESGDLGISKISCEAQTYSSGKNLSWIIPDTKGLSIQRYGIQFHNDFPFSDTLHLKSVQTSQKLNLDFGTRICHKKGGNYQGWINTCSNSRSLSCEVSYEDSNFLTKNEGTGFFVTGNRNWNNFIISAEIAHKIGSGGIVVGYQGLNRFTAFQVTRQGFELQTKKDRIINKKVYTNTIPELEFFQLQLIVKESHLQVMVNGKIIANEQFSEKLDGGAGFILENGSNFFRKLKIQSVN